MAFDFDFGILSCGGFINLLWEPVFCVAVDVHSFVIYCAIIVDFSCQITLQVEFDLRSNALLCATIVDHF